MKRFLPAGALCLAFAGVASATDASYVNSGTVTFPPQIDAITFVNNAIFSISTTVPFKTQNTLNYSNFFEMTGNLGYDFALYQGNARRRAANFYNEAIQPNGRGGLVEAPDAGVGFGGKLLINATNIVNRGRLATGTAGLIRLEGNNVQLPFSVVDIIPIGAPGTTATEGLYDRYWGAASGNIRQGNLYIDQGGVNGSNFLGTVSVPSHSVTNYPAARGNTSFSLQGGIVAVNTNVVIATTITLTNMDQTTTNIMTESNSVVDIAFISPVVVPMDVGISFSPSTDPSNYFSTITVQLQTQIANTATRVNDVLGFSIVDQAASEPSTSVVANYPTNPPSYTPTNISVTRVIGSAGVLTIGGNATFDPQMIIGTAFTNRNRNTPYFYAGYHARVDNLAGEPPSPLLPVTNLPGRVEILADSLNMDRTHIRGEGLAYIKANHLISATNTLIDAQDIVLDFGSTNGTLALNNLLVLTNAVRLRGDLYIWSGVWTNSRVDVFTNNFVLDAMNPTNADGSSNFISSPITNIVDVGFHVLAVLSQMESNTPVNTHGLFLRATNVTDGATNFVSEGFFTDAERFTLNGSLSFGLVGIYGSPSLQEFVATNAPNLRLFTNNGILAIPGNAHFGDDRAAPYDALVNTGSITVGGSLSLSTAYLENPGTITGGGSASLNAQSAKLEGGRFTVPAGLQLAGGEVKLRNYTINAGALYLMVTNALFDNGSTSSNRIQVGTGFQLLTKPATGDLLGTQISSSAPFNIVQHVWAGEDRGATAAGFKDNVAIGRLTLSGGLGLLNFKGTDAHNGLYVDFLQINGFGLTNLQDLLVIDPSLTIYFAAANIPAGQLDGMLGGRLRWVKDFAGPNSSSSVLLPNGSTIVVNKGFRESMTIDSDADGLPNGADTSPFDGVRFSHVTVTNQPPPFSTAITWEAAAGTAYRVEFATNLVSPAWQFLLNYTNTAATNGPVTIMDQGVPPAQTQRYYRVIYAP